MRKLGSFAAGVLGAVVVGGVAVAVREWKKTHHHTITFASPSPRRTELEIFAEVLTSSVDKMMGTMKSVLVPEEPLPPLVWNGRLVDRNGEEITDKGGARTVPNTPPGVDPWFFGGPDDMDPDTDYDPTNLDGPLDQLDRVMPMQPGSIGPVIEGGTFRDPTPDAEPDDGPRVMGIAPGEQPLRDLGLTIPQTDLT